MRNKACEGGVLFNCRLTRVGVGDVAYFRGVDVLTEIEGAGVGTGGALNSHGSGNGFEDVGSECCA